MDFDRIAPFYGLMERCLAGGVMHRARVAFLDEIPAPRRVLLVGEGHGRFLEECLARHPAADFTVVDGSARMLEICRGRVAGAGGAGKVRWVHAMMEDWDGGGGGYDLIVTDFLLDCLSPEVLEEVVRRGSLFAAAEARWLIADFHIPAARGFARLRARAIVRLLYVFFRITAGVPGDSLQPADAFLERGGFRPRKRRIHDWGLLESQWWERMPAAARSRAAGGK